MLRGTRDEVCGFASGALPLPTLFQDTGSDTSLFHFSQERLSSPQQVRLTIVPSNLCEGQAECSSPSLSLMTEDRLCQLF